MPDIILSNSSHHGTCFSFFARSISLTSFSLAAMIIGHSIAVLVRCFDSV